MSSLIPPIGSYIPTPVQIALRASAPIVIDYFVTRFLQSPRMAMIPALGAFALGARNITPIEKVAEGLLYIAYKTLHTLFSSTVTPASPSTPQLPPTNFGKMERLFLQMRPWLTESLENNQVEIDPSRIHQAWNSPKVIDYTTEIFKLAAKDSQALFDELTMATFELSGEAKNKKMAELLIDLNGPDYPRFCDASKPSLLFFYRFVRWEMYYKCVEKQLSIHTIENVDTSKTSPFYLRDTKQSEWQSLYNTELEVWAKILKHLPADSVARQWAVADTEAEPLKPGPWPKDFLK